MTCPHCLLAIHVYWEHFSLGRDEDGAHFVSKASCPACHRIIAKYAYGELSPTTRPNALIWTTVGAEHLVNPFGTALRPPPPSEVPEAIRRDYNEAALVLSYSPKASAALSRRCLQNTIREAKGIRKRTLEADIEEVIDRHLLTDEVLQQLAAVRVTGNFAAHPIKDTETGVIVDVEPEEAEWNLDVLDLLFEQWYVQPARAAARREALNEKLRQTGKPPI